MTLNQITGRRELLLSRYNAKLRYLHSLCRLFNCLLESVQVILFIILNCDVSVGRFKVINEFVQVTDRNSEDRYLINLSDISFIREIKGEDYTVIKLKSKEKMILQVRESFESFEEFFEDLGDE